MNSLPVKFMEGFMGTLFIILMLVMLGRLMGVISIGRSAGPSVMVVDTTGKVCKLDVATGATK